MNEEGKIVKDKSEAHERKWAHKLIHPEYVLFAAVVGSNTNQKEDGNGKSLTPEEILGYDIFTNIGKPHDCISANFGKGKRFPGGPKYIVGGRDHNWKFYLSSK